MSIFLVRHTAPLVSVGTCYGQADLDVTATFEAEATTIRGVLAEHSSPSPLQVYSSPLQRCRKLAEHLFPAHTIQFESDLMELHCGEWELMQWNDIPREVIDPWMKDFVNYCIPGGESYVHLFARVVHCFEQIEKSGQPAVIVTHGGVMRSILSHITNTPLVDSFAAFSLHYGCVVKLDRQEGSFQYQVLSNISTPKEQHKPQY